VTAVDLEGITVILDAGHGGRDVRHDGACGRASTSTTSCCASSGCSRPRPTRASTPRRATAPPTRSWIATCCRSRAARGAHHPAYPSRTRGGRQLQYLASRASPVHQGWRRRRKIVFISITVPSIPRCAAPLRADAAGSDSPARRSVYDAQEVRRQLAALGAGNCAAGSVTRLANDVLDAARENLPVHPFKPIREGDRNRRNGCRRCATTRCR
jgi:hypothetical protein